MGLSANPWATEETNFDKGFDEFIEISANNPNFPSEKFSDSKIFKTTDRVLSATESDLFNWSAKKEWFSQWTGYYDIISDRIEDLEEPYFVWIFLLDTHQPYFAPSRYRVESSLSRTFYSVLKYWRQESEMLPSRTAQELQAAYRDSVRSVDGFLQTLWDDVADDNTVLAFHSDHGEALGERDQFGHESTLFEFNIRVPFVIFNCGRSEQIDDQISLTRLPEILLDAALGRDNITIDSYTDPTVMSKTENGQSIALRTSNWKIIDGDSIRLFDVTKGPIPEEKPMDIAANQALVETVTEYTDTVRRTAEEAKLIENGVASMLASEDEQEY